MSTLLSEDSKLLATFGPKLVVDTELPYNQAIDMQNAKKATFEFGTDDLYDSTDGDLTLQLFEVATDVTTGGVALPDHVLEITAPATPAQKQGSIDILKEELTDGKRFVYGEILSDSATQLAIVWGTAHGASLGYGTARKNPLTGTTYFPTV